MNYEITVNFDNGDMITEKMEAENYLEVDSRVAYIVKNGTIKRYSDITHYYPPHRITYIVSSEIKQDTQ